MSHCQNSSFLTNTFIFGRINYFRTISRHCDGFFCGRKFALTKCERRHFGTQQQIDKQSTGTDSLPTPHLIAEYLTWTSSYPSTASLHEIQQRFQIKSIEETRDLLRRARRIVKRGKAAISPEERLRIHQYILASPRPRNAERIRDELHKEFPHLSRRRLYVMVLSCCISVERKETVTPDVRQLIERHVLQSENPRDIAALCDELESKFNLDIMRSALITIVQDVLRQNKKKFAITRTERNTIRQHVLNSPRPLNPERLRDELFQQFPHLSKDQLYHVVQNCCVSVEREEVITPSVRQLIEQHVAVSKHPNDVSRLCDEIQAHLKLGGITRKTLFSVVENCAIRFNKNERVTEEERNRIREYVRNSPRPLHPERLRDELHEQFAHISRRRLYVVVVDTCISVQLKEVMTPQVRRAIEEHVEKSEHPSDVTLLCDELQGKLGLSIMRGTLYKVVRGETRKRGKGGVR